MVVLNVFIGYLYYTHLVNSLYLTTGGYNIVVGQEPNITLKTTDISGANVMELHQRFFLLIKQIKILLKVIVLTIPVYGFNQVFPFDESWVCRVIQCA